MTVGGSRWAGASAGVFSISLPAREREASGLPRVARNPRHSSAWEGLRELVPAFAAVIAWSGIVWALPFLAWALTLLFLVLVAASRPLGRAIALAAFLWWRSARIGKPRANP